MEKSIMMEMYEEETGRPSTQVVTDGVHRAPGIEVWHWKYVAWLEQKLLAKEAEDDN